MGFVAWKMYQWIMLSKSETKLHKKVPSTFGLIVILSLIPASVFQAEGKFGQCASWCWINGPGSTNARMGGYYAFLLTSWSLNVIVLIIISLRRKSAGHGAQGKRMAFVGDAVQNKLTLYVFVFSFCWFFSVVDFICEYAIPKIYDKSSTGETKPIYVPSSVATALFTPLHGFGNCLVFHGYLDWVIPWMTRTWQQLIRKLFAWSPLLASWCKCCLSTASDSFGAAENGKGDGKKFVVRRASTSASLVPGAGAIMGFKPKRGSVVDKIDKFAFYATESTGFAGTGKIKSPLSVPATDHRSSTKSSGGNSTPDSTAPPFKGRDVMASIGAGVHSRTSRSRGTGTPYVPKTYSIFVTTFNVGEAKVSSYSSHLADWIIPGHDIYSIGVQECLDLQTLRDAIYAHLGGPDEYKMFCTGIGSDNKNLGYHGFIALTVFVRTEDFNAGRVRETHRATADVAAGQNLIIVNAQNKGAVGIPFQIHDTSVAFLASHLPSDQKGASKLAKRNNAACMILKELVLVPADVDFDMHLQHDHVFFTGDLNYRMDQDATNTAYLNSIVEACKVEKSVLRDDPQWLARKYSMLRSKGDDMYPVESEKQLIGEAKARSEEMWINLLRADELRNVMMKGDAFTNFAEETPAFPPTYKRTKAEPGCDGGCGDYTVLADFIRGFSHTGADADGDSPRSTKVLVKTDSHGVLDGSGHGSEDSGGGGDVEQGNQVVAVVGGPDPGPSGAGGVGLELTGSSGHVAQRNRELSRVPSFSNKRKDDGGTQKPKLKNLRAPSYTDRILIHSLEDREAKLRPIAYDFCDLVRASDHRPVSLVCQLEVNATVLFPTHFEQPLTGEEQAVIERSVTKVINSQSGKEEAVVPVIVGSSTLYLFELCITHLTVELFEREGEDTEGDGVAAVDGTGDAVVSPLAGDEEDQQAGKQHDPPRSPEGVVLHKAKSHLRSNTLHTLRHSHSDGTEGGTATATANGTASVASRKPGVGSARRSDPSRDSIPELDDEPAAPAGTNATVSSHSEKRLAGNGGSGKRNNKLGGFASYFSWLLPDDNDQKKPDTTISEVEVVFPLPSKDPLCQEKSDYRKAQNFGAQEKEDDELIWYVTY